MQVITETELLERINAFLERHEMARPPSGGTPPASRS
jgi:hypothetical protein